MAPSVLLMKIFPLTRILIGKREQRFFLTSVLILHMCIDHAHAQDSLVRWELSAKVCVFKTSAEPERGATSLRFLPATSGELTFSYIPIRRTRYEWLLTYCRGSLPVKYEVRIQGGLHPDIPGELDTKVRYVQHPYNTLGLGLRSKIWNVSLTVYFMNRFYARSHASSEIGYHTGSSARLQVYSSETETNRQMWSPQISISLSGHVYKKVPSWNYEIGFAFAPVNNIIGAYSFFPDDPALNRSGSLSVDGSFFSVGIIYRRVRRN